MTGINPAWLMHTLRPRYIRLIRSAFVRLPPIRCVQRKDDLGARAWEGLHYRPLAFSASNSLEIFQRLHFQLHGGRFVADDHRLRRCSCRQVRSPHVGDATAYRRLPALSDDPAPESSLLLRPAGCPHRRSAFSAPDPHVSCRRSGVATRVSWVRVLIRVRDAREEAGLLNAI